MDYKVEIVVRVQTCYEGHTYGTIPGARQVPCPYCQQATVNRLVKQTEVLRGVATKLKRRIAKWNRAHRPAPRPSAAS